MKTVKKILRLFWRLALLPIVIAFLLIKESVVSFRQGGYLLWLIIAFMVVAHVWPTRAGPDPGSLRDTLHEAIDPIAFEHGGFDELRAVKLDEHRRCVMTETLCSRAAPAQSHMTSSWYQNECPLAFDHAMFGPRSVVGFERWTLMLSVQDQYGNGVYTSSARRHLVRRAVSIPRCP